MGRKLLPIRKDESKCSKRTRNCRVVEQKRIVVDHYLAALYTSAEGFGEVFFTLFNVKGMPFELSCKGGGGASSIQNLGVRLGGFLEAETA